MKTLVRDYITVLYEEYITIYYFVYHNYYNLLLFFPSVYQKVVIGLVK